MARSAAKSAAILGFGAAAAFTSACATTTGPGPVGSATTTSAPGVYTAYTTSAAYTPGAVELYGARGARGKSATCPRDLPPNVEFAPRSAELVGAEGPYLDQWSACLNHPELQHTTVVLVGGDDPAGAPGLFLQRARVIKDALVMRGVDEERIVIGASHAEATRGGGYYASPTGVRMEITHNGTLRAFSQR